MANDDGMYRLVGAKIAFYRKIRNMTQVELADKVGISSSYISKIECGNYNRSMSLSTLINIADGLDVDAWKLLKVD